MQISWTNLHMNDIHKVQVQHSLEIKRKREERMNLREKNKKNNWELAIPCPGQANISLRFFRSNAHSLACTLLRAHTKYRFQLVNSIWAI